MNAFEMLANHQPLFAEARGDIQVSFEFFPPKTEKMAETCGTRSRRSRRCTALRLGHLRRRRRPRERTHQTVERILKETSLTPAAHLTCVGASRGEIDEVAREYWELGVRHIVALRGDPPEAGQIPAPSGGYRDAAELVAGLKKVAPFDISVAAYPEVHPDSSSRSFDIENLSARWTPAPIARSPSSSSRPTASSASGTRLRRPASTSRSCPASCPCRTSPRRAASPTPAAPAIPEWLDDLFEGLDDLPSARQLIAATVAAELCGQLYAGGVRHFHFYTLNRAELSYAICHLLASSAKP